ncbi:MAG: hypothetical protein JKY15_01935 [Deltaproteobacteria bacterium]|nr:hypothetical protein [Deltaproteobacteria bacterium]
MSVQDDDEKAIGRAGRQEGLTMLIFLVFGVVGAGAIITLVIVFFHPELMKNLTVTGTIDLGRFIDKIVESYDAFLLMLGVSIGTGGTLSAIKLGKSLAKN